MSKLKANRISSLSNAVNMALGGGDSNKPLGSSMYKSKKSSGSPAKKTLSAAKRDFYKPILKQYIGQTINKTTKNGDVIKIGFSSYGNKHLYSDTFGRSKHFQKSDLMRLDELVKNSIPIHEAVISKPRKDNIIKFYYFKVRIHGSYVYLNVAKEYNPKSKRTQTYLYSVTDKIKEKNKDK